MTKNVKYFLTTILITFLFFTGNVINSSNIRAAVNPKILSVSTNPSILYTGDGNSITINSVNSGKVQYRVLVLAPGKTKWEDASGGYSPAVDSGKPYNIKIKKVFSPGNYKISVWTKKAGTNGRIRNSAGYGNYDSYLGISKKCVDIPKIPSVPIINIPTVSMPKISSVNMVEGYLAQGMQPSIKIAATGEGNVQYKVMMYTEKTGKWEDASNGYTSAVNVNSPYIFKFNKAFEEGNYRISVWIKRAGTDGTIKNSAGYGSYDNYLSISKECIHLPEILSAEILEQNLTQSMNPSIRVITQGKGQVQYKVLVLDANSNKWEDASNGYTSPVNASEPYVIKLNKTFNEGNNRVSIWVKRSGADGVIHNSSGYGSYDDYIAINKEISFAAKIASVKITNSILTEGVQPTISIMGQWKGKVQYRAFLSSDTNTKLEDVSNGYTNAVDANVAFNMNINKKLNSGNYKLTVWVKSEGSTGIKQDPNGLGYYDNSYSISFTCKPTQSEPGTGTGTGTETGTGTGTKPETGTEPGTGTGIENSIKVCLDAGHGGSASGTVGATGTMEKDIAFKVTNKVGRILKAKGIEVIYTRTGDDYLELSERCDISDRNNVELFVSIHCNSYKTTTAKGIETFSYKTGTDGEKLAKSIQNELIKATGLVNRGTKTANYYVIKNTAAPSILTEIGFMSNLAEEQLLKSDAYQEKCANAIANGIMNYLNR